MDESLSLLIPSDKSDYIGYSLLRSLLQNNEQFRNFILQGVSNGSIKCFDEDLWDKLSTITVEGYSEDINLLEYLKRGRNIGNCTNTSIRFCYAFDDFIECCGGTVNYLIGTQNSPDGRHTWVSHQNKIIDPSLLLVIDEKYAIANGYNEENRYDPTIDIYYQTRKERAKDLTDSLKNNRKNS